MRMNTTVALPKLHNRFDIVVTDTETGEIVQEAIAENIVLDRFYHMLMSNSAEQIGSSTYKIAVGDGIGELSPTRAGLFNKLLESNMSGFKYTITPDLVTITGYITIGNTSLVGKTLREVGLVRYYSITHALLTDSEGNPITIGPKTNTQVITITATFYCERPTKMKPFPNGLSDWIRGASNRWLLPSTLLPSRQVLSSLTASGGLYTSGKTLVSPISLGRNHLSNSVTVHQFGSSDEGFVMTTTDIIGIVLPEFPGIDPVWFPNHDLFPPFTFSERQIGTGDGHTTLFNLDSGYFIDSTLIVKVNGIIQNKGVDYTARQGGRQLINGNYPYPYPGVQKIPVAYSTDANKQNRVLMGQVYAVDRTITTDWGLDPTSARYMLLDLGEEMPLGYLSVVESTRYTGTRSVQLQFSSDDVEWETLTVSLVDTGTLIDMTGRKARYIWINNIRNQNIYGVYLFGAPSIEFVVPPPAGAIVEASWQTEMPPKNINIIYTGETAITYQW